MSQKKTCIVDKNHDVRCGAPLGASRRRRGDGPRGPRGLSVERFVLPTYLASALINGDTSGLSEADAPAYRDALALAEEVGGHYVSMGEDEYFSWSNDLPGKAGSTGGDVAEFVVLCDPAKRWVGGLGARRSSAAGGGIYRSTIVESMGRTLYVTAYADAVEQAREDGDEREWDQPGPGEDWMDYSPETTSAAKKLGRELARQTEKVNGRSLDDLFLDACRADGIEADDELADKFGHYLAMQALGAGVSWFDDHEEFPIKIPSAEFYLGAPDDEG